MKIKSQVCLYVWSFCVKAGKIGICNVSRKTNIDE